MSDTKETSRKTLTLNKTVDAGHVKQSFSHGRSKPVLVEKKKKRVINRKPAAQSTAAPEVAPAAPAARPKTPAETPPETPAAAPAAQDAAPAAPAAPAKTPKAPTARPPSAAPARGRSHAPKSQNRRGGKAKTDDGSRLSAGEQDARMRALTEARKREVIEAEERVIREAKEKEQAKLDAARAIAEKHEREAEEKDAKIRAAEEEAKAQKAAAEKTAKQQSNAKTDPPSDERTSGDARSAKRHDKPEVSRASVKRGKVDTPRPSRRNPGDRMKGRLTITNALEQGSGRKPPSIARLKRQLEKRKKQAAGIQRPQEKIVRVVTLPEAITIQELSNRMAERAVDVIKLLMKQGNMHEINDVIDADTAEIIAEEMGHTVKRVSASDVEEGLFRKDDDEGDLLPRAPVVTVMGHVDHGKTSLLDAMRSAKVAEGEAGGITQHIGAYQVKTEQGGLITFIDTPGHAAFTAMRARGAKVTDIVVLVVAADDGVMPQTIEAINHAKAAEVPIIVAINKIDVAAADPNRVRNDLLQHDVFVESLGGEILDIEVSAKQRINLEGLLEAIHLQSELLELKANPERSAEGVVVEAQLERGRGPVGTVLVQRGSLKVGNILVAGSHWGKVRALIDDHGNHVATAGPSQPVEVLGFNSAPDAGDECAVVDSEAKAREITEYRDRKRRDAVVAGTSVVSSLEQMMDQLKQEGLAEFPLLIKADVQGSVEAIVSALDQLGTEEVRARIIHSGVGGITESDITLAGASNAVVFGFNVRANQQARALATQDGVEVRYYAVIYDLVDDIKAAMSGLLKPTIRENFLGNAEILEVFNISKVGKVAGCKITEGKVERGAGVRLIRDNVVMHEGKLSTLKRFKDEVSEVPNGQECGMAFENYEDMRAGDVIECFQVEEIERTL